jgi:NAD(P)-dependent dehydrogenase (short-subunit alcohol dehydrogenase family)
LEWIKFVILSRCSERAEVERSTLMNFRCWHISCVFAREGAKVVIVDVLEHEARQVADSIRATGRLEPLDVTKEENWAAAVTATAGISASSMSRLAIAEMMNWLEANSQYL